MFSLCIPTMNRYDNFLSKYLSEYLKYDLIDEIIISDENGEDVKKIKQNFPNNDKIKLFVNQERLGPFLNKLNVCSKSKNEWIVLIDSDNFADENYFITGKNYIINNNITQKNIILAPSFAKPTFNYKHLNGQIFKKNNFNNIKNFEKNTNYVTNSSVLMNTGNYILNKYLIDNINLTQETNNIPCSSACDVIYFNTLLFEQLDLNLHVVSDLEYTHTVHSGSIYSQTCNDFQKFNQNTHERYYKLI